MKVYKSTVPKYYTPTKFHLFGGKIKETTGERYFYLPPSNSPLRPPAPITGLNIELNFKVLCVARLIFKVNATEILRHVNFCVRLTLVIVSWS